jgi:hypothetical protein
LGLIFVTTFFLSSSVNADPLLPWQDPYQDALFPALQLVITSKDSDQESKEKNSI